MSTSSRSRRHSEKSNTSKLDESTRSGVHAAGLTEMEYFWSIELNADNKTYTWMNNDDIEDDDEDFIEHTIFLKSAVLGAGAVPNETNVVMLGSAGGEGETMKGAIANLCLGQNSMTTMDMTVSGRVGPTTFTLEEGSGPVFISGNHLMEYPKEDSLLYNSQTESEEDETEEEDLEEKEEKEEPTKKAETEPKKAAKRKAESVVGKPKKAKMEVDEEEDEIDEEDEEEEEEEEEDEESEEESEEEVKLKKTKKGKDSGKKETPKGKASKKTVVKKGKK